jgi:hypothetical protein
LFWGSEILQDLQALDLVHFEDELSGKATSKCVSLETDLSELVMKTTYEFASIKVKFPFPFSHLRQK